MVFFHANEQDGEQNAFMVNFSDNNDLRLGFKESKLQLYPINGKWIHFNVVVNLDYLWLILFCDTKRNETKPGETNRIMQYII